jgi:peptide/nickel transport system ATP-binding protein
LNGVTKEYCLKQTFFSKGYACVLAPNNIDLTIQKGEIFGLVGESGRGKTTKGRL